MSKLFIVISFLLFFSLSSLRGYNVAIVGYVQFFLSLGRVTTGIIDCIKDDFQVSVVPTRPRLFNNIDVPQGVYATTYAEQCSHPDIAILTDHISMPSTGELYKKIPENSRIKIAYTMVESTKIPHSWVQILNEKFDMAVVPHPWLIPIYKNCGVTIPLFVLAPPLYLADFYQKVKKKRRKRTFRFGVAAGLLDNKNIPLLINAFKKEFKQEKHVRLYLHTPRGNQHLLEKYQHDKQIKINTHRYSWRQYLLFFSSLDCYVLPSKGEGFSITPYEALACGIPCILTNNTAHTTLCNESFVRAVPSSKIVPAVNGSYGKGNLGDNFDCRRRHLRKALRDVYEQYEKYKKAASLRGSEWAMRYFSIQALKPYYTTLCKPSKVILGNTNEILPDCLITNSRTLYEKYMSLQYS